jgi:predicted DNA-binding transcriptional regulator AlpA
MIDLQTILSELRQLRADLRIPPKRLLNVAETARYLGVAEKTVRNGLGPRAAKPFPIKPVRVGGRVLFKRESLDAFIDGLGGVE